MNVICNHDSAGLMLEDMEELFAVDPGMETCLGCFPVLEFGLMGFRTLSIDRRRTSRLRSNKKSEATDAASSESLFEPASLHKYSTGMREMHLEYFSSENEPLIPANVVAIKTMNATASSMSERSTGAGSQASTGGYGTGTLFPYVHTHGHPYSSHQDRERVVAGGGRDVGAAAGAGRERERQRERTHKTVTYSLIPDLNVATPNR
jgi:hypothetical protein